MLKIAICEDEQSQRELVKNYINRLLLNKNYEIFEFKSGEELIANYPQKLDILFLDIQMEEINGMDTARTIRTFDNNVEIIFITGIWDYVQEGYEVRAYRYIIKPIGFDNFDSQLNLCLREIENKKRPSVVVTYKGEVNKIELGSIVYIETDNRNTIIHTDQRSYKSNMGINKIEKHLEGSTFFRCHNSFIINLEHINQIGQDSVFLGKYEVQVSRHKMKDLKIQFTSLLGDKL
ncbi:DNA-binding response regulator [[Clostridium] sordellii]|uniref:LytR/AlgR family response regulator transcription factor n=1 Tax=Paraclostridium sordellii TaxID=1505 RepID=UPI0005DD0B38|nr:LytTR family DNA-binding domain-containing protein [Paeniclostridium sordellii]CEQ13920.1 DNA-binding response regulator [[Clostridium] sordellii] [Paeniclostridium sordellii]